jgi:hypothetical protein
MSSANGAISLRLSRSVDAALLAGAKAGVRDRKEGESVDVDVKGELGLGISCHVRKGSQELYCTGTDEGWWWSVRTANGWTLLERCATITEAPRSAARALRDLCLPLNTIISELRLRHSRLRLKLADEGFTGNARIPYVEPRETD